MLAERLRAVRQNPLTKNIVAALGGNVVFWIASFVRNLFLANLLGPTDFGAWNLGLVFIQYAQWSHFSLLNSFRLEGARSRGAGNMAKLGKIRQLTWTACTVPAFVVTVVAGAISLYLPDHDTQNATLMLVTLLLPYQLYTFVASYLSVEERFSVLARVQIAYSVTNMILTLALAWKWGYAGALAAQLISYLLALFLSRQYIHLSFSPLWDGPFMLEQIRVGLPIGLNGILYTLFISLDRTLVASILGFTALGHYSLTALTRSTIGLLPSAISDVIYMRASTRYGETRSVVDVRPLILHTDLLLAYVIAPLLGLAVIWVPWGVRWFLPSYNQGVVAVQIFLVGLFFTFPVYAGVLLTSIGRAKDLLWIYGAATILQGVWVVLWLPSLGITGAALATACSSSILFLVINVWGLRYAELNAHLITRHILDCLCPLACLLGAAALAWMGAIRLELTNEIILQPIFMSFMVLGMSLPLLWWRIRRLSSLNEQKN